MAADVQSLVGSRREELIDLTRRLIRARTYNPPGKEVRAAEVLCEYLDRVGIDYQILSREEGRANVIATVGEGGGRTLLLAGHLDTVPPGGGWTVDPLGGALVDGRIYGRGATDMKGGVAASAVAMAALADAGIRGRVILAATADEEMGSEYGMAWLARERFELLKADFALICEPSGSSSLGKFVVVGEKGSVVVMVRVMGRSAHSSVPAMGDNAVVKMSRLLSNIHRARVRPVRPPITKWDLVRQLVRRLGWRRILRSAISRGGGRESAALRAMTGVTVCPSMVQGGEKDNVVPDLCEATVDFRILPGQTPEDVIKAVEELASSLNVGPVEVGVKLHVEPSVLRGAEGELRLLETVVREVYGERPIRIVMPGASDARFLRNWLEIPAAQFGPGLAEATHAPDEYVEVEDLVKSAAVYAEFALRFFGD